MEYLQVALEAGWSGFDLIERDPDLDPLRKLVGFQELIKKHDK
jgi:hypothetical protein